MNTGTTSKRCFCRDRNTGKPLGAKCPKLRRGTTWNPHHGVWQYQIELPKAADGRRRPLRRGAFDNQNDAGDVLRRITDALAVCEPGDTANLTRAGDIIEKAVNADQQVPDPEQVRRLLYAVEKLDTVPDVAGLLTMFITSRGGARDAGRSKKKKIKEGTRRSYQGHIDNHLVPHLGTVRADRLTAGLIEAMFEKIEERNERIDLYRASPDPQKQDEVKGLRTVGIATQHRILATLRAAYNWAMRRGIVAVNPAKLVEVAPEKAPKKLVWTAERVAEWRLTGKVPEDAIMVWTPEQTGVFLDHLIACNDPLYALYHIVAYRGLRRGEACGLHRVDYDRTRKKITIAWQVVQHGWEARLERPKTDDSYDDVPLDDGSVIALDNHLVQQRRQRLAAGAKWVETGLCFTTDTGAMLHPAAITDHFYFRLRQAGLPPIGLHGLRHGAATINLAAGVDMRVVQELLRHSSITVTSDLYTSVLPDLAFDAAEKAAASVPRRRHLKAVS
ncbi:tyrosine-type recombinase/integrase [Amorphoplanes nipponensis]|uniref:Site-specific integrase n=1 Tax=Actinoplanes nipponensis TaxID=135950 RepID=A0A919MSF8_9ACTN|nr:site-specific integrase [Actinoplanes nipponensis]GIE52533.1 site-specific integrase [Actinoplanes nipponensis]